MIDFTLPVGSNKYDPAGAYNKIREKAKEFWEECYYNNSSDLVRLESFLNGTEDDHTNAFNEALDYCRTNKKDLLLEKNAIYKITNTLNIQNVRIYGNYATIEGHAVVTTGYGPEDSSILYMSTGPQNSGVTYNLSEDAKKGDRFIKVTNSTFLSTVKEGDVVLIRSAKIYGDGVPAGELHQVYAVHDWGIYIDDFMFHSYFTSDTARISILPRRTCELYDFTLIHYGTNVDIEEENATGISLSGCYRPIMRNVVIRNTYFVAVVAINCYAPLISHCYTAGTPKDGYGYGISIAGVTTNAIVENCIMTGARHPFHSGGSLYGVPWNIIVKGCRASNGYYGGGTCYDAHRSVGSITYDNCHAFGGLMNKEDSPIYDAGTTYSINDVVRSVDGIRYASLQNGNIGNALTNLSWWNPINGSMSFGFNLRIIGDISIKSCYAYHIRTAINGYLASGGIKSITIDGLVCYNCTNTITIQTSNIEVLSINNVKTYQLYPLAIGNPAIDISLDGYTIGNVSLSNIEVYGQEVMRYKVKGIGGDITMFNIIGKYGVNVGSSRGIRLDCVNAFLRGIRLDNYDTPIWCHVGDNFDIELDTNDYNANAVYSYNNIKSMTLTGRLRNPRAATSYAFYARENVTQVMMPYLTYIGNNDFYLAGAVNGKSWGSFQYGNISVEGTGTLLKEFNLATPPCPIILAGSNKDVRDCITQATPEGSITARIGAIARDEVNGKLYFKATGAGNTGWKEINIP